jgi:hypothetical protein
VAEAIVPLRNRRFLLFLLALIAVAAGYYLLVTTASPPRQPESPYWLYAVSEDDIEKITISVRGQRQSFVRNGAGWFFEAPADLPVDMARWSAVPLLLSGTTVARRLEATDDISAYGLDEPAMIIDLFLRGQRRLQIQVGDKTPDGANYYVAVAELPDLSLVNAAWGNTLMGLVTNPPFSAR